MLIERAPAKINLSLHVGLVKPNGRHDLNSLVTFADSAASDHLEARPATHFSLSVEGPYARESGPAKDNLVLKAARAVNEALEGTAPPLAFRLEKNLPCAAGIGGGSADAGAALRIIAKAHGGDRVQDLIKEIAPSLGGDVLACVYSLPGLMTGEGEHYEPLLGIPTLPALLVNPGMACPTGPVFAKFDEDATVMLSHPLPTTNRGNGDSFLEYLEFGTDNTLQAPAQMLVPEISAVLGEMAQLSGARLTRMSGSGATCFSLFETLDQAALAAVDLRKSHPDWWVVATMLGGGL
ncbi:MAG: 4-(cytidine 5'-diphospho)-2-C-methyl-D-erythritol kinase [Henriciella sp.]|nr:4-(cytidine 5'-diphospho)-2-C-methyl-D-erythritol kinase [Henriciella sp.]